MLARQIFDAINHRAEAMGRDGDERPAGVRRFHGLADAVLRYYDQARADGLVA